MTDEIRFPVTIHTDGGCSMNPGGEGSFAALLSAPGMQEKPIWGYIPAPTTSNRAEWAAVIEGLKMLRRPCEVTIISDSRICVNAINGVGRPAHKRGNQDLVRAFGAIATKHNVSARWVRGHNGDANNELCDQLCARAMKEKVNPYPEYSSLPPVQNATPLLMRQLGLSL